MFTPTFKQCYNLSQSKDEFKMFDRGSYVVFDYVVSKTGTFDCKVSREMRGIAFDKETDQIISRPLHKFFNLGEREETREERIDFRKPHHIVEKLDGSMIRTINLGGGKYRLGTRAGVTDIAMMAEEFVAGSDPSTYEAFIQSVMTNNKTAIFEFCSRKNRVVIDHPVDRLVLLAIRDNVSGEYVSYEDMCKNAKTFAVEYAQLVSTDTSNVRELANAVKEFVGTEGVIVQFYDGFRIKIKGEDYLRKHGALDGFRSDKKTLELVLSSSLDDVLPLLDDDMKGRVTRYRDHVLARIELVDRKIRGLEFVVRARYDDRKNQAQHILTFAKEYAQWIFAMLDGKKVDLAKELSESSNKNADHLCCLFEIEKWSEFE